MNTDNILQLDFGNNTQNLTNPISLPELNLVERNSLAAIDCSNILELIDDVLVFLTTLETKLRLHGECYISGTSINLLSEYYLDDLVDIHYFNSIIGQVKRLYSIESLVDLLKQCNFSIKNIKTHGINYYMVISRTSGQ